MKIVFLIHLFIEGIKAAIFEKVSDISDSNIQIVYNAEAPSLLSCTQKCYRSNAMVNYDAPLCKCFIYMNGESKLQAQSLSGFVYQQTSKAEKLVNTSLTNNLKKPNIVKVPIINKPSSQKSTYNQNHKAAMANDGDLQTSAATMKVDGVSDQWWSVDLEKVAKVYKVIVHLKSWALGKGYYKEIKVEVGKVGQGKVSTVAYEQCTHFRGPFEKNIEGYELYCDNPIEGSFVRIYAFVLKGERFYLSEVEVYKEV